MDKIAVHVPNHYLSEAVQKHQIKVHKKQGLRSSAYPTREYSSNAVIFIDHEKSVMFGRIGYAEAEGYQIISVDEYFKRFNKPPLLPIRIGGHEVEFSERGIRVGCQDVRWEEITAILDRRRELYGEWDK